MNKPSASPRPTRIPIARRWLPIATLAVGASLACAVWGGARLVKWALEDRAEEDFPAARAPVDRAADSWAALQRGRLPAASGRVRAQSVPPGDWQAHLGGFFGPAFEWPIVPLHMALLPDGRVFNFGREDLDTGALVYNIWDPALGTGPESMMLLPNITTTDIFCVGQVLLPGGEVLMVGGDLNVDGVRNYGTTDVTVFSPSTNLVTRQAQSMAYPRWYPTAVTTADNEQVVLGGRMDPGDEVDGNAAVAATAASEPTYANVPEVYNPSTGWRTLTNAPSDEAYGALKNSWFYPRGWLAPDGRIFILAHNGHMFYLDHRVGAGLLVAARGKAPRGYQNLPSVMYAPGKILSVRRKLEAVTINLSGGKPKVSPTGAPSWQRAYANATVLPDGKVFMNGGSSTGNDLVGAAYHTETWDPATGLWTSGAVAAKARLYHSAALLLPDATVLTGGGGTPGPVTNMNGEIYYPPYLYRQDGSGQPAERPVIQSAPTTALGWGQNFEVMMDGGAAVSRVTLLRYSAVTHSFNNDQRFIELPFTQQNAKLKLTTPSKATQAPPGYYLLFVLDAAGVPSVARTIRLVG